MQDKFDKLQAALSAELRTQLSLQTEELREIVKTTAGNYGGVLDAIYREVGEFREEWRKDAAVTNKALANHVGRISALERRRPRLRKVTK